MQKLCGCARARVILSRHDSNNSHFILFRSHSALSVCRFISMGSRKQQRKRFNLVRLYIARATNEGHEKRRADSEHVSRNLASHYLTPYFHIEPFVRFTAFVRKQLDFGCWNFTNVPMHIDNAIIQLPEVLLITFRYIDSFALYYN